MHFFATLAAFAPLLSLVSGHARLAKPTPLGAPPSGLAGNYYNAPLKADGSDFPCKGLHKKADLSPVDTWQAGSKGSFE